MFRAVFGPPESLLSNIRTKPRRKPDLWQHPYETGTNGAKDLGKARRGKAQLLTLMARPIHIRWSSDSFSGPDCARNCALCLAVACDSSFDEFGEKACSRGDEAITPVLAKAHFSSCDEQAS